MAESGKENLENQKLSDKEARLKLVRDKQNDDRQKKLEEMMAQAQAAQRFREQKEQERRRRFDEMRTKDDIKKQQVVERKKVIDMAEKERAESILKKNYEKSARIEAKRKNERSNIVFAFGSSTPRMLDPTDTSTSTFWGRRRATSTQNITSTVSMSASAVTLTRRQSERDLDSGSKKRATSAGGLDRTGESNSTVIPAGCASGYVGRRRTDLMPTIPYKESPFAASSRKSLNHSPGRAYSMSRLDQLSKPRKRPTTELPAVVESTSTSVYSSPFNRPLSSPRQSSVTRSMSHLAVSKTGPPQIRRPLNKSDSRSMHQLSVDGPFIAPRTTRATQLRQQKLFASSNNCNNEASSRPSSALSQQSTTSVTSAASVRHRPHTAPRHPRPISIAITGVTEKKDSPKVPLPLPRRAGPAARKLTARKVFADKLIENDAQKTGDTAPSSPPLQAPLQPTQPTQPPQLPQQQQPQQQQEQQQSTVITTAISDASGTLVEPQPQEKIEINEEVVKKNEMTEEKAKAALAEKRRFAREEAERKAEEERLRIEAEHQAELERQRKEEEQMQLLIEQQRQAEQERLEEAIKEAQKREEEERLRKEEECRLKLLKEEAERKAREEAEKQKNELQERLKNEEKEREMRRKRVEAIMLRTRGKNSTNNSLTQSSEDNKNENKSEINGTKPEENGTKNGKVDNIVDNIIADNSVKNANIDTINTDSINSNSNNSNPWQATQTFDPLM